jgi:hypothetical protein
MKIRFVAASVLTAALLAGSPVLAQPVAAPAMLSLALASPIILAPAARAGVWLPAAEPVRSGPRMDVHRAFVAALPTDRFVSGSVQFDYGAAGLEHSVSTFGYAHTF